MPQTMSGVHGKRENRRQHDGLKLPLLSDQNQRLPSIPEGEPLVIAEDTSRKIRSKRKKVSFALGTTDAVSAWCHSKLQDALSTLMQSEYAAPLNLSLQSIEQGLQDDKYRNDANLFWSDVAKCLDTSAHSGDAEPSFADFVRFSSAANLRALAEELEFEFWDGLFASNECAPDEEESEDAWGAANWVLDTAADWGEWLLFSKVNEM